MKIAVIGSASGISMPGRGHASVTLETGGALYVFDAGEPAGRELLARNMPIEGLRTVFISHMHADHVGGLFQLVKNLHLYHNHPEYLPQVDEVTLCVPEEAVGAVRDFFIATYSLPERMAVRVEFVPVLEGVCYRDDLVRVTAHHSNHLMPLREFVQADPRYSTLKCQAFSYSVEAEGKRLVYSGDLGAVEDIIETARGADLVLLEFGHLLPLEENLRKLANLDIGRIVLTHIFPDYTDKTAELQETADSVLPGKVVVAEDGLEVEL